jgi:hypothetical protein
VKLGTSKHAAAGKSKRLRNLDFIRGFIKGQAVPGLETLLKSSVGEMKLPI